MTRSEKGTSLWLVVALLLFSVYPLCQAHAADFLAPDAASQHVGETQTVCGTVASATYAAQSKGQPTFLNLDKPYPNHVFTIVIWGPDRGKFEESPEKLFRGKKVCVTGLISSYRGKPQIVVKRPSQIKAPRW